MRLLAILAVAMLVSACAGDDDQVLRPSGLETEPVDGVPADWATYTDPVALFTVRYPAEWFLDGNSVHSRDLSSEINLPGYRPHDVLAIGFGRYEAKGSNGCGAVRLDPATGEATEPAPGATTTTLGGAPAWEIIRTEGDNAIQGELTRIHAVSLVRNGQCINVGAYFYQNTPDEATFSQILGSFELLQ